MPGTSTNRTQPAGAVSSFFAILVVWTLAFAPAAGQGQVTRKPAASQVKRSLAVVSESSAAKLSPSSSVGAPVSLSSNPSGIFLSPVSFAAGGYNPVAVAVADINGDGKPDMVVGNQCTGPDFCGSPGVVSVLLGIGDGTFHSALTYPSGGSILNAVAIADVNGDGKPDVIAANECDALGNCTEGSIDVLLGNGDGTLQSPISYGSGAYRPQEITVADVNGDGRPDLLVANLCASTCDGTLPPQGSVSVLLGVGDGTFLGATTYASGGYSPLSIAVGYLNGDQNLDVVVSNTCGSNGSVLNCPTPGLVAVLAGNGDGTLQPAVVYETGGLDASAVAIHDVNGDGNADLLVANCGGGGCTPGGSSPGNIAVLLGHGDGTFQPPVTYGSAGFFSVLAADVRADGLLDILAASWTCPKTGTGCVSFFRANGDGTFQSPKSFDAGTRANAISVADVNGDGVPDLLATHGYGNGPNLPPGTVDVLLAPTPIPFESTTTTLFGFPHRGPLAGYLAVVTSPSGALLLGHITFSPGGSKTIFNNHAAIHHRWPYYTFGTVQSVIATYSGDKHHSGSTSNVFLDFIPQGKSFVVLTTSGSPSLVGQPVTFNARVSRDSSTGPLMTFYDGKTLLTTIPLQGGQVNFTTASLPVGVHSIKAFFPGDTQFTGSYDAVTQVVNKYATTATLTSTPNPSHHENSVTFTVAVSSPGPNVPTGAVQFTDGGNWLGSAKLVAGVAALTKSSLAVGTHAIAAKYLGSTVSAPSISAVLNQVVQ
jgi:hypothetical protein